MEDIKVGDYVRTNKTFTRIVRGGINNMGEEKEITFVCKPIESTVKETIEMDYKKEYKKMQSRYNKLLDENKKLNKALVNLALKVK